nr:MAG TPA: hypothetical protein [Caudoviricetes sp.]
MSNSSPDDILLPIALCEGGAHRELLLARY